MKSPRSEPFCDWLDVTCHPDSSFLSDLTLFLSYHGYPIAFELDKKQGYGTAYSIGDGVLVIEASKNFHRASASGGVIRHLEKENTFRDYINIIGTVGHNITRLDVAVDIFTDAPPFLRTLEDRYPDDLFYFGRKSTQITRLYSTRLSDSSLTGTWYIGHRSKARITARVYDKQYEALQKRGEILPPTTRIELTFRKDFNCSLYDVLMPKSLFYTHATPKLIDKPLNQCIPLWEPRGLVPWESTPKDYTLTLQKFDTNLSRSPEFRNIAKLGSQFGESGRLVILRHFEKLLNQAINESIEEETIKTET